MSLKMKQIMGGLAVFASAFCFYLATVVMHHSYLSTSLSSGYFTFMRFFLGLLIVSVVLSIKRKTPKPIEYRFLFLRAIANLAAVFCFYKAVELTTTAEANILNMTFPVFIAILSWIFIKGEKDYGGYFFSAVAFLGIAFLLNVGSMSVNSSHFWGLASGLTAAIAMIALNITRQKNDTDVVLFVMFAVGTFVLFAFLRQEIYWPSEYEALFLLLTSFLGILGQYLLTLGQRFVSAVETGIIASTRILLAACLAPLLTQEPSLALYGWIGALLIFTANIYLAFRRFS